MIIAVELNELSAGDLAGHIAASRNAHGPIVAAVQHQRGHGNLWQEMSHVGVAQRLEHGPDAAGTGGRAQQPGPPGPRLGIASKARREGFDPGRATPFGDELLARQTSYWLARNAYGKSGAQQPLANEPNRMRPATRRGSSTANLMHAGPHSDAPNRTTRRVCAARSTVPISSAVTSTLGADPTRSDSPMPRRSNRMSRPSAINETRNARHEGCSQTRSTCDTKPGTIRISSSPLPYV